MSRTGNARASWETASTSLLRSARQRRQGRESATKGMIEARAGGCAHLLVMMASAAGLSVLGSAPITSGDFIAAHRLKCAVCSSSVKLLFRFPGTPNESPSAWSFGLPTCTVHVGSMSSSDRRQ